MWASGRLEALQSRFIASLAAAASIGRSFHLNLKRASTRRGYTDNFALPDLNAR